MPRSLDEIVALSPAVGWIRLEPGLDWIFVPLEERDVALASDGSDHLSLYVHVVGQGESSGEVVSSLMRARVRQGEPEELDLKFPLDGSRVACLGWTDGVSDVVSYFAAAPTSELVEFQVAHHWHEGCHRDTCPSVHELAQLVLARVTWR